MELKIAYAMRGEEYVSIRGFQSSFAQDQAKIRPTDLSCPECDQQIVVRYPRDPNVKTVVVHYAHTPKAGPDYRCALANGESAEHFNAKVYLARQMQRAVESSRGFALVFRCRAEGCRAQEIFFEIKDYDRAEPERKVGRLRPDISCFRGQQPIGAAEVCNTHAVGAEKQYDLSAMGLEWFEIPAKGLKEWATAILPFNSRVGGYTVHALDANVAGITYPLIPAYCDICERRYRHQGIMAAAYDEQMASYKARVARHVEAMRANQMAVNESAVLADAERARIEAEFYAQPVSGGGEYLKSLGCLYCARPALLQDRHGAGCWFCARCRAWFSSSNGRPILAGLAKGASR